MGVICYFDLKIIEAVIFLKQVLLGEHGVLLIVFSHNSMFTISSVISIYLKTAGIIRCNVVLFDLFPFLLKPASYFRYSALQPLDQSLLYLYSAWLLFSVALILGINNLLRFFFLQ